MPSASKLLAVAAAVVLNSVLIVLPVLFANQFVLVNDARLWVLLILANGLLLAEGQLQRNGQPRMIERRTAPDTSAHRLALLSSLTLLGIYWTAIAGATPASTLCIALGVALFALGITLRAAAIRTLGDHFRSDVFVRDQQPLVRDGIYRHLRHPSETGLLLVGLGAAVMFGSLTAFALWLGLLAPLTLKRIALEERCLRSAFGEEYQMYSRRTGGLLPRQLVLFLLS